MLFGRDVHAAMAWAISLNRNEFCITVRPESADAGSPESIELRP